MAFAREFGAAVAPRDNLEVLTPESLPDVCMPLPKYFVEIPTKDPGCVCYLHTNAEGDADLMNLGFTQVVTRAGNDYAGWVYYFKGEEIEFEEYLADTPDEVSRTVVLQNNPHDQENYFYYDHWNRVLQALLEIAADKFGVEVVGWSEDERDQG